jgi:hypothetical protein
MRKELASAAAALAIVFGAGAALADHPGHGQLSFEAPGETVRPAELTQGARPQGALGQARHGYYYRQCYNYYRWQYNHYYGWQRYYVGTRCYY